MTRMMIGRMKVSLTMVAMVAMVAASCDGSHGSGPPATTPLFLAEMCGHPGPADVTPVIPKQPTLSFGDACAQTAPVDRGAETEIAFRGEITGRWMVCPGETAPLGDFEVNPNQRWQALAREAGGGVVPAAGGRAGRTTLIDTSAFNGPGSFQVNLLDDAMAVSTIALPRFSADGSVMRLAETGGVSRYARVAAGPLDGNPPPALHAGSCTLLGSWEVIDGTGNATATFLFDSYGQFLGGDTQQTLCDEHSFSGTYTLSPGFFGIATSQNMGCPVSFDASYHLAFSYSCDALALEQIGDNCTGGRLVLGQRTSMRRTSVSGS